LLVFGDWVGDFGMKQIVLTPFATDEALDKTRRLFPDADVSRHSQSESRRRIRKVGLGAEPLNSRPMHFSPTTVGVARLANGKSPRYDGRKSLVRRHAVGDQDALSALPA
jgi:hypothetical protein